jgi:UDP-3-O-[3-hydroxymyristoyl] glucosamine N-acyltransferase
MEFSAQIIANFLGGQIDGNPEVTVNNISKIEEGQPGTLSFLANPKYTKFIYTTCASIVLVNKDFAAEKEIAATLIRVEDAYQAFAKLLELYEQSKNSKTGIEQPSYIHSSAKMGSDIYVGAFAYIGEDCLIGDNVKIYPQAYIGDNVHIGEGTTIMPGVKIYADTRIGKHCIIHAGVVIGSDGFGFAPNDNDTFKKVPQIGNVIIADYVEIGSNTTIDRATLGSTIIHKGVKLDNLIQVAHNVEIGQHTVIAAQTGISGSTKIGADCMFGGQVGIVGHVTIADETKIGAQAGVAQAIKEKGKVMIGSPAIDANEFKRSYIVTRRLPEMWKKLIEIEKKLADKE